MEAASVRSVSSPWVLRAGSSRARAAGATAVVGGVPPGGQDAGLATGQDHQPAQVVLVRPVVLQPDRAVVADEQAHGPGLSPPQSAPFRHDGALLVADRHVQPPWSGMDQHPVGGGVGANPAAGERQAGRPGVREPQVSDPRSSVVSARSGRRQGSPSRSRSRRSCGVGVAEQPVAVAASRMRLPGYRGGPRAQVRRQLLGAQEHLASGGCRGRSAAFPGARQLPGREQEVAAGGLRSADMAPGGASGSRSTGRRSPTGPGAGSCTVPSMPWRWWRRWSRPPRPGRS